MQIAIGRLLLLLFAMATVTNAEGRDGHFWLQLRDKNIRMDKAVSHFGEWLNLPADATFQLLKDETDNLGIRHLRYRQYVAGVEVQASMVMVHGRDGYVTSANGVVMERAEQPKPIRRAPTRDGGQQILYLVKSSKGYRYAYLQYDFVSDADVYVDTETGEVLKSLPCSFSVDETMKGRTWYSGTVDLTVNRNADGRHILTDSTRHIYTLNACYAKANNDEYQLSEDENGNAYYDRERYIKENCPPFDTDDEFWMMPQLVQVSLDSIAPQDDPFAEVYFEISADIQLAPPVYDKSERVFVHSLPVTIDISALGGPKAFYNMTGIVVKVWQYQYLDKDKLLDEVSIAPSKLGRHEWKTTATAGHVIIAGTAHPALDIHWGMMKTYDWYKSVMGRDSYDGLGSPIYNILFAQESITNRIISMFTGQSNAFANNDMAFNCPVIVYGIGDDINYRPLVSLDVLAHEFTHLVTSTTAKLEYQGEAGALNESFSDIMGISVKRGFKGPKGENWLIGDEVRVGKPCMRDMSHQVTGNNEQPIYYKGESWIPADSEDDNGGVHTNSGVQNYWFYLLCNDYTDEWGMDDFGLSTDMAAGIAYRNLTQYLSESSNYDDARQGSLQAAADLYGEGSDEYRHVDYAWKAVGVMGDNSLTGILPVIPDGSFVANGNWYNLQGQRVDKPIRQGFYIRNGKKIIIK